MSLRKKIIAVSMCMVVGVVGFLSLNVVPVYAQTQTTTSSLTIEQLQQIVLSLQQQITAILQLLKNQQAVCGDNKCTGVENASSCAKDCKCAKEGESFDNDGTQCCAGLSKKTINPCGDVPCSSVLTYTCRKATSQSQYGCTANADCVSDSGTCHQCFNKTWWNSQAAEVKRQWMCSGIGSAICQCKSGKCASVSVCGDRVCDIGYETSANCAADCSANCTGAGVILYESDKLECCAGLTKVKLFNCASGNGPACFSIPQYVCKKAGLVCGDNICEIGETSVSCTTDCGTPPLVPPTPDPITAKTSCTANADCVSDSGTCHQCFNKNWWSVQGATVKAQWQCKGVGNSICQCKAGTCVSVSVCGDGSCDAGYETSANCAADCTATPIPVRVAPKVDCVANADCVSDSGACHQCFNKTWWNSQAAEVKRQWMCWGIGSAICQCKAGICTSVSDCGDRVCDVGYENSTNCATDCR